MILIMLSVTLCPPLKNYMTDGEVVVFSIVTIFSLGYIAAIISELFDDISKSTKAIKVFSVIMLVTVSVLGYTAYCQNNIINGLNKQVSTLEAKKADSNNSLPLLPKAANNSNNKQQEKKEYSYVANSNSGIFHHSSCSYVGRMSPSNKVAYDSRDDAIDDGYRPCKKCRP